MLRYLEQRDYLAVWHSNTPQENALAETLVEMAADRLQISAFRNSFGDDVREQLRRLRDTGAE